MPRANLAFAAHWRGSGSCSVDTLEHRLLKLPIEHAVGSHYTAKRLNIREAVWESQMESTNRLSEQQKEILRGLLKVVRTLEYRNDRLGRIGLGVGIEWRPPGRSEYHTIIWRNLEPDTFRATIAINITT